MKKSNVYTRTGDNGTTSLVGGKKVHKSDQRIESYGTVDELNSFLALLVTNIPDENDRKFIKTIQHRLFVLGSYLATPAEKENIPCKITEQHINEIENEIDRIDEKLPPLKFFVIPGGSSSSALAHIARSVCRRAEREMYRLSESDYVETTVLKYINRLSDYLFVLSRKLLHDEQIKEFFWDSSCV
ncbi:MAG: cob(I)yrinic acid a,c-diamide adenosyltransferase [Bacteroidales bacterium]|nr:cob(I)yrinic acid a,c-diamide adenosyltransferase [Bacteroidales bacterium]